MSISKNEVKYIASLARLKFSDSELESYTKELNSIIEYMDKLNELDTENVSPLSHPIESINVFRDDEIKKSISSDEALKNAPDKNESFFKVPKVIKSK
jgi:aspartyl-tRNA(Asn)/glutamyl-tRNA(Gln) amidotransferase subunit C